MTDAVGRRARVGRLKHEWALAPLRVRGIERVKLHADLTILAKLACGPAQTRTIVLAAYSQFAPVLIARRKSSRYSGVPAIPMCSVLQFSNRQFSTMTAPILTAPKLTTQSTVSGSSF
jgi:hypothetical protein